MSHNLLLNASFHHQLLQTDKETLESVRQQGCPSCSGPLHLANYPRNVFGIPLPVRHFYEYRFSLCCGHCRQRVTPSSVRFLGARRFAAFIMVLICAQRASPGEKRLHRLFHRFGLKVSLTTWKRWRKWWKEQFPRTAVWTANRGLFVGQDAVHRFPADLIRQFSKDRLMCFLRFISPLSIQFN